MKTLIPWFFVVALIAGAGLLFISANRQKEAELAQLRVVSQEVETLRAENAELKNSQVSHDEITRLRKDSEDVLRLRNTVRQLGDQITQLNRQLQSAQTEVQRAQGQVQAAQSQIQTLRTNKPPPTPVLTPEQQASTPEDAAKQMNACINNLRRIDGAKQQWALENGKQANAVPTWEEIAPYLGGETLPPCPARGAYTLNSVGQLPTCSIPGHELPK